MAIKKRAFNSAIQAQNSPTTEDMIDIAVKSAEDAGLAATVMQDSVIIELKRTPPRDPVEAMRLDTYCLGNERRQLHPKDESTERLLAGVRYVQNEGKEARIEKFYRDRIRSPLTAIRAFMVLAADGPRSVNDDTSTDHPLWLFRSGKNPFYGKLRNENEEGGDDD